MTGDGSRRGFRHGSLESRRRLAIDLTTTPDESPESCEQALGADPVLAELADVMVESAIGYYGVPLGVASGFLVNDRERNVPMATEEPSVIAAATFAARRIATFGGIHATAGETITSAQLFVEQCVSDAEVRLRDGEPELVAEAAGLLESMTTRGGGWRGIEITPMNDGLLRLTVSVDVRDALGANLVNSVGERIRPVVERLTGGRCLMSIVTNESDQRVATARFTIPFRGLERGGVTGDEIARRIVLASAIAQRDEQRAVTHNKGIMNGITALTLATGNDTRALEAAAHRYATRSGSYRGLSTYEAADGALTGTLTMPIALGTVGGATGIHPTSRLALRLLGSPTATELAEIAVAVGLAQNFAALHALVTEGIQRGHMGLHAHRVAYMAGARDDQLEHVVAHMRAAGDYSLGAAKRLLDEIASSREQK